MSYYPGQPRQPRKTTSQANGRQNYFPSFSDSMFGPFSFGDSTRDMIEQHHPYYKHQQEQAQRRQMAEQQQRENELRRQQLQRNQQEAALRRHLHNQQQQEAAYQKQQEGYQKQHEAALRRQQHQQQVHQQHHQSQRSKKQQEQLQHLPKVASEKPPEHPNPQARSQDQMNQDFRPHAIFPGQSQVSRPGTSNKATKRRARRQRQAKESGHQDPIEDIATHSFFQPIEQKNSMNDIESLVEAAFGDGSSNHKNKSNSSRQHQRERLDPSLENEETKEDEEDEEEKEEEGEEEQVSTPETSSMETSDQDDQDDIHEEEEEQEQPHPQSEKRHAELQAIEKNLDELEVELKQILTGQITKKKQILMTEEMLTKAMLKVDSIESEGDWSIRRRRKSLINRCESLLERVDGYKRQHREELRW
ncbi:hypothetical protein BG006_011102 [Podila minutissima]|uniref:BAG domain-containing protein n=1 Tax=Podila minutissima TaxID=64525 RepID=A0A9P5SEX4_9FUNG|nr:hypothetical protein BG006_011102 [Podila minutissima]